MQGTQRLGILQAASRIETGLQRITRIMVYIASAALAGMMLLTVADVVGRYFFSKPIKGAWELTGFLLVCAGAWTMAYSQITKGHIRIDFLMQRFSQRAQAIITAVSCLIGLACFSVLSWRGILMMQEYLSRTMGNASPTLGIPLFPFALIMSIGAGILALALLADLIHSLVKAVQK